MAVSSPQLKWCIVRLGKDMNWWIEETSDPVRWDPVDGLSILDPSQANHMVEVANQLVDYGFRVTSVDQAFYKFRIEKKLPDGRVRLKRVKDTLLHPSEPLFALPDVLDEERGPYADFLQGATKARVRMLNEVIDFDHNITVDELEEEIREIHNQDYLEGRAVHLFSDIISVMEYVPAGYELDDEREEEGDFSGNEKRLHADLDHFEHEEDDEKIEEDETMKWGEEEEQGEQIEDYDESQGPPEMPQLGVKSKGGTATKSKPAKKTAKKKTATKKKK